MHQNNVDIKEIQMTLGHADIQTTYGIYVKTNSRMMAGARDSLYQAIMATG